MIQTLLHLGVSTLFLAATVVAPTAFAHDIEALAPDGIAIRAAWEDGRHRVVATTRGHRARCDGQQFTVDFDERGATVTPDAGGWSFGLQFVPPAFDGGVSPVPQRVEVLGRRLSMEWSSTLTEWYVNGDDGLEHGFTLSERPAPDSGFLVDGRLVVALRVHGGLTAHLDPDALGATFVDRTGSAALTYRGLLVLDACGAEVAARLAVTDDGLAIEVDDASAVYPLVIDPVAQQAYLKASNTGAGDGFGFAVAISGDTAVVGANQEDSNATGIDGDESDNSAANAGAAYVFVRSGSNWTQQAYLKASNTGAGDSFGRSVAIDGDTLVVGAYAEGSSATGSGGDESNNSASGSGAVYVFVRTGTTWTQQAYLKASNTGAVDRFGQSVSIDGDTLIVGAYLEDGGSSGVGGDESDNSAADSGAAYVFVRVGTVWSQQAYLKPSDTDASDFFGWSVDVAGDTAVVGAYQEDSNATGIDGDDTDDSALQAGAAYVFVRSGTSWSQQAYLKASNTDAGDRFGRSVAAFADRIAIGAYEEDSSATGIDGNDADNSALNAGAVYVFERSGSVWFQQAYVKASSIDLGGRLGESVALDGKYMVIGATGEASSATGIDGDQTNNGAPSSGAIYAFEREGSSWVQRAYAKASNTDTLDGLGNAVAVSGTTAVAGARFEDSGATGIGGDQSDNGAADAGAVYVFDLGVDWAIVPGCLGNTATFAIPAAAPQIGQVVNVDILGGTISLGVAATYYGAKGIDIGGCGLPFGSDELLLAVVPFPELLGISVMTAGVATQPVPIPNKVALVGVHITLQAVVIDTTTFDSELSTGLVFEIRP